MKAVHYIFVLVFLTIITLPLVLLDTKSTISESENRTLAAFPNIITDGVTHFPKLLDTYIGDRFGLKNEAVAFINNFNSAGTFQQGNVILGKDKWLFFSNPDDGNNILDFLKINLFSQDEIEHFITNIENRLEWCNTNNIKFIFLIAPNKHNVYPEQYPIERPDGITRTEQIMNVLPDNLSDRVIYPLDYIINSKTENNYPLYNETDTHWNSKGAYYAYKLILQKLQSDFPDIVFPELECTETVEVLPGKGDIVPMLGLESYGINTTVTITPKDDWSSYYTYIKKEGNGSDGIIIENKNPKLPKAIIFRDSFFFALEPFTSTLFSSAEYNWRWFTENEKEYILENKPDILIWEVVERHITGVPNATW